MKRYCLFILVSSLCTNYASLIAQTPGKYIFLDSTTPAGVYYARDSIVLKPGFIFTANNNSLDLQISENLLFDVDYLENQPDPDRSLDKTLPVGSTSGSISVSPGGTATYGIPIYTPPGTAGIQPVISIVYNSQAGNGMLGYGWNIAGLSAITRTPKTIYNDGTREAIKLDTTDRFTLDGNRLICTSGKYGTANSQYRTEMETFTKITAYNTAGTGPSYFIAETKDGMRLEFGNSTNSRVEAYGSSNVLLWRLNKVTDVNGNYIEYHYGETNGESYITQIDYTGNSAAGLSPYNTINFYYETRQDQNTYYVAGSPVPQTRLLRKVAAKCEGQVAREYDFSYTFDIYSHFCEIKETGSDGKQLNSTIVEWGNSSDEITDNVTSLFGPFGFYFGDYNGDGRMDIVKIDDVMAHSYKATGDAGFMHLTNENISEDFLEYLSGDFDGDGLEDLINVDYYDIEFERWTFKPMRSSGTDFDNNADTFYLHNAFGRLTGDFDGDGKSELLVLTSPSAAYLYDFSVSGSSFTWTRTTHTIVGSAYDVYSEKNKFPLDFNGDGKTDILVVDYNGGNFYEFNGSSFVSAFIDTTIKDYDDIVFGNFNEDNYTDLFMLKNNAWYLYMGKGNSFEKKTITLQNITPMQDHKFYAADLNGNGLSDLLVIDEYGKIWKYYNNGNEFSFPVRIYTNTPTTQVNDYNGVHDFSGDGVADLYYDIDGTNLMVKFYTSLNHNLVQSITDGLNRKIEIDYTAFHASGTGAVYPVMDYHGPLTVVTSVKSANGLGGQTENTFTYYGAKIHLLGKGFLGFTGFTSTDVTTEIKVRETNELDSTFYFLTLKKREVKTLGNESISATDFTNAVKNFGNKRIFPYVSQSVDSNKLQHIINTSAFQYDDYGNNTSYIVNHSGEGSTSVTNTFVTAGAWCPSKIDISTTTLGRYMEPSYTRKVDYNYNASGQLTSMITDPDSAKKITTTYEYNNPFGNLSKVTSAAAGVESRYKSIEFDTKGRFVTKETNALGHYTAAAYDGKTGNVVYRKDINQLETSYQYDGFGRLIQTTLPNGNQITEMLYWNDQNAPDNSVCYSLKQADGLAPVKTYLDSLSRVIRVVNKGFNGTDIYTDVEYNAKMQLCRNSEPYFAGGAQEWTEYSYDFAGRNTYINSPTADYSISYNGRTTTTTNVSVTPNQVFTKTIDALGKLESATDAGGTLTYRYYSSNLLKYVISPGGAVTNLQYDYYGNQTLLTEPNAGTYTYTYNAFGEMITQNANGKLSGLTYDRLGRITTLTAQEGTTTYTWDTKANGKGLIANITSTSNDCIYEEYTYDEYSRLITKREDVNMQSFYESIQYDVYGRISQLTYPSNFAITYHYNQNHYLSEIKRADNSASIWKAESMNARGQILQSRSGNNLVTGYTYDHGYITGIQTGTLQNLQYSWNTGTGNLTWRKDAKRNLTENFTYDNLNRLTQIAISGGATYNYSFSANGNIATSTPAGTYTYDATKLHFVKSVTNPQGIISTAADQTVEYTSYDKVKKITEGIYELQITYGINKHRGMTVYKENGVEKKRKYYAHGNYETINESGSLRELHYISGGTGMVAIFQKRASGDTMFYVHTDHLGSLHVITDPGGTVKEELSFDAWGRRRNPANWTYTGVPSYYRFDRGYTGHEHLDRFGLINMNGRMYDPVVGRFLSPDPFVQAPGSTQSYNRYSYCVNNPLRYVDPSGYFRSGEPTHPDFTPMYRPKHKIGAESPGGSYTYDWNTGLYKNAMGEVVTWTEVYSNYIVPNSTPIVIPPNVKGNIVVTASGVFAQEYHWIAKCYVTPDGLTFSEKIGEYYTYTPIEALLSVASGAGSNGFTNLIENTSLERDVATVVAGILRIATDGSIPAGKPRYQPRGYNPNVEAQVAKGMKVANGVVGVVGKTLGVLSAVEHGNRAYQAFNSGNIWQGIGYTALTGLDIGLMFIKSNPAVLAGSVIYGVLDATVF